MRDDDAERRERQARQDHLRRTLRFEYLGQGPSATSGGSPASMGWHMAPELYAYCPHCDYYLTLDPSPRSDWSCPCHFVSKDADAGRFSCRDGDAAAPIYRGVPLDQPS